MVITDTLGEIEARIRNAASLSEERKAELLALLSDLKAEVSELSKTHAEHTRTISGFTKDSIHEATREKPDPETLKRSLERLTASVEEFETSHPKLVGIVNSLSLTLANLGI